MVTNEIIEWFWKCPECDEDLNLATTEECDCGFVLTHDAFSKSLKELLDE